MTTARKSAPAKSDAIGTFSVVEYDGATYAIPPIADWDLEVLESVEDGRITGAVRILLGDEQWRKFKAGHKVSDLRELFKAIEAAAVGPGN